jgi:hypothetical protein
MPLMDKMISINPLAYFLVQADVTGLDTEEMKK